MKSATLIARQVLANDQASEPTRMRKTRVLLVDGTVGEVFCQTVGFHCTCCPWPMHVCRSVTCKLCSPGIFFRFPLVPNAEDDWWFCFRSRLWPVIIPASHCMILSTIYRQEDAALPAFLCGLRVGMMLTRRSCMGIRGRLRLSPALAQATFTARMFICLDCDHTCLQKSLSFAPGLVVLHRLPLMPAWSTSHRSLDFVRTVKLTTLDCN